MVVEFCQNMKIVMINDAVPELLASTNSQCPFVFAFTVACPSGFTYRTSTYSRGCYKAVTRKREWSVAALACRSLHPAAHLLVIGSYWKQRLITSFISVSVHFMLFSARRYMLVRIMTTFIRTRMAA